jgi:hypothetical protein
LAQSASPSPAPSGAAAQSATNSADADITARAKAWLHRFQTGIVDSAARNELDAQVGAALTPDALKQIAAKFGPLGEPVSFTFLGKQTVAGDNTAYVFHVTFKTAAVNEVFVLDNKGKISGIQFPPAQ